MSRELDRPSGGTVMGWGWTLIVVGGVLTLIGMMMSAFSDAGSPGYGSIIAARPPVINPWKLPITLLGAGLANLGVLLAIAGYIVRAMYFLPGRPVPAADVDGNFPVATSSSPPAPAQDTRSEALQEAPEKSADQVMAWFGITVAAIVIVMLIAIFSSSASQDAAEVSSSEIANSTNADAEPETRADPVLDAKTDIELEAMADALEAAADNATVGNGE